MEAKTVADHSDKFRVGRLAAGIVDGITKIGVQNIHVATVPSNLNCVADGAFHA